MSDNSNEQTVLNLQAAEVGLLDCHDYDKLRKRMLPWPQERSFKFSNMAP